MLQVKTSFYYPLLSLVCGAFLNAVTLESEAADPAFRMGVGLSDSNEGNPSVGFSSLVGPAGLLPVGFYYEGNEVGAVLPLSLSGDPTRNYLLSLGFEIYLASPVTDLGFTLRLYDVAVGGLPTAPAFYSFSTTLPGLLGVGSYEILVDQIPTLDALYNLDGKSAVALTLDFNGLQPGLGGLSIDEWGRQAIDFEIVPGTNPNGRWSSFLLEDPDPVPEGTTIPAGVLMAVVSGFLYWKHRRH